MRPTLALHDCRPAPGALLLLALTACAGRSSGVGASTGGASGEPAGSGASSVGAPSGASSGATSGASAGATTSAGATSGASAGATSGAASGLSDAAAAGATASGVAAGSGSRLSSGSSDAGDASAVAAHCAPDGPGLTDCGDNHESCCTSVQVTGGAFYRTYDRVYDAGVAEFVFGADGGPVAEADPATVSTFQLDKYLVTVGRFRQFVGAWNAGWRPAPGSGKHTHLNGGSGLVVAGGDAGPTYETGWLASNDDVVGPGTVVRLLPTLGEPTWTDAAGSNESRPMNGVFWEQAYAFCIWDGGFLPSEAELQYAEAGGDEQRPYPWGSTDPGMTDQYAIYGGYYTCTGPPGPCASLIHIAPVGTATLGTGRWGQLDLVGELWEFTVDWAADAYASPCVDCTNSVYAGGTHWIRGGEFSSPKPALSDWAAQFGSEHGDATIGMRCAREP